MNLAYGPGREWWTLSNGYPVATDVAAVLITRPDIEPAGGTLISDTRPETWRHTEAKEETQ